MRYGTGSSPVIFTGVLVLVYVALRAKGVNVEVPPVDLLTIFVFEVQAAVDAAKSKKMINITEQYFLMIRRLAYLLARIILG